MAETIKEDVRETVARIIDPHSFLPVDAASDEIGEIIVNMVDQGKNDALRKADRIIAALASRPIEAEAVEETPAQWHARRAREERAGGREQNALAYESFGRAKEFDIWLSTPDGYSLRQDRIHDAIGNKDVKKVMAFIREAFDHAASPISRPAGGESGGKVKVRPLGWVKLCHNGWYADSKHYMLHDMDGDGRRIRGAFSGDDTYRWFKSMDEAKAAAQSDYEARIRSALSAEPPTVTAEEKAQ